MQFYAIPELKDAYFKAKAYSTKKTSSAQQTVQALINDQQQETSANEEHEQNIANPDTKVWKG